MFTDWSWQRARSNIGPAMRGGGLCQAILAASALSAGCSDRPLCRSEVFVAFAQTRVAADLDDFAPGIQTSLTVRTSLHVGDVVTLEVVDAAGTVTQTAARAVGDDGTAEFDYVTVPASHATLRASGSGLCGDGHDEIMVEVPAGAGCAVELATQPEHGDHYGALGVLAERTDLDPVTPGYQTQVLVATRPGWAAEVFETTAGETSLGVVTAGGDGIASVPVGIADGPVAFRATCRGAGAELASRVLALVADTTPPSCELIAPAPGAAITPASDPDHDLGNGLQVVVIGRAADPDVAGEPVTLSVTETGGGPIAVPDTVADGDGTATTEVTLLPALAPVTYQFALTMRDHAGNACTSVATYAQDP
jgi:hypothetical protein